MKADDKMLQAVLKQDITFTIPVYQRNYDWKKENCKRLFFDVLSLVKNERKTYFIGSIVRKSNTTDETIIIDGQQRITSIMLFLKALYDLSDNERLKEQIYEQFLTNKWLKNPIKLNPIEYDRNIYCKLINDKKFKIDNYSETEQETNVFSNYNFFRALILENINEEITIEKIKEAIERLMIVDIQLTEENPQIIFESLNSTGLDLSAADLLRNYCLMSLDYDDQERLYKEYWSKIEKNVTPQFLESFMLYYLILKKRTDKFQSFDGKLTRITTNSLYQVYKKEYPNLNTKNLSLTENLLSDMYKYSCIYKNFVLKDNFIPKPGIEERLNTIFVWLEQKEVAVLLMYLFNLFNEEKINENTLIKMLDYIITLIFRSKICGTKGATSQTCASYIVKIEDGIKRNPAVLENKDIINKDLLDIFLSALTSLGGDYAFPNNEVFKDNLFKKDLYHSIKSKGCKYLFYTIEKHDNKECPDPDKHSIEHIMPQKIEKAWIKYLDSFSDRQNYEKYLHTLGNLTLTGYNSELGNRTFEEKKKFYKDSSYTNITKTIAENKNWTSKEITERAAKLVEKALEIWYLDPAYQEISKPVNLTFDLDTPGECFINTRPSSVTLFGNTYPLIYWWSMLNTFFEVICDFDKDTLYEMTDKEKVKEAGMDFKEGIIVTSKIDSSYSKIDENLWYYNPTGPRNTINCMKYVLKYFYNSKGVDLSNDIEFTIGERYITRFLENEKLYSVSNESIIEDDKEVEDEELDNK